MRKFIGIFLVAVGVLPIMSVQAAVQVKKAAPVATSEASGNSGGASLVPNVLGLVAGVIDMNKKQNELSEACIPSSTEIKFVEDTIKEWAKTGRAYYDSSGRILGDRIPCETADGFRNETYRWSTAGTQKCYNYFDGVGNADMVWQYFPKPGIGTYCKNGMPSGSCSGKDLVTVSDVYDIFNLIDFVPEDYRKNEATIAGNLLTKAESCSNARLSAKKKALWGEFLMSTVGNVGTKTNTGSIMEQVGSISTGGGAGALQSLGGIATQFMNK